MKENILVIGGSLENFNRLQMEIKVNSIHYLKNIEDIAGISRTFPADIVKLVILNIPVDFPLHVFHCAYHIFPETPIIVIVAEYNDLGLGLKLISLGAQDYLVEGQYNSVLLQKSIHYAVERFVLNRQMASTQSDYVQLFMNNPIPFWVFDNETLQFLSVNSAAVKKYGYSTEEFENMTISEIRSKEQAIKVQKIISINKGDDFSDSGIWKHIKKSGEEFYVQIFSQPIKFKGRDGRLVVAVDVNENILYARETQELNAQVKAYSNKVNSILESITDGFLAIDKDWKFTYTNQVFEKLFLKKSGKFIGESFFGVFPKAFEKRITARCENVTTKEKQFSFEEYYALLDLWLSVSVYPSHEGYTIYIKDITKARKMQELIFKERLNLNALINNTDDFIWSLDVRLRVLSANEALKQFFQGFTGRSLREGDYIHEGVDAKLKNIWLGFYKKALEGISYRTEIVMTAPGKDLGRYMEVSFNPIRNHDEIVIGVGCYARDITEMKNYQIMIEQHNRLLEEIAWKQSHKIRGPVASIMGIMQVFDYENLINPLNIELLGHLNSTLAKLDNTIKDIVESTISIKEKKPSPPFQDS